MLKKLEIIIGFIIVSLLCLFTLKISKVNSTTFNETFMTLQMYAVIFIASAMLNIIGLLFYLVGRAKAAFELSEVSTFILVGFVISGIIFMDITSPIWIISAVISAALTYDIKKNIDK